MTVSATAFPGPVSFQPNFGDLTQYSASFAANAISAFRSDLISLGNPTDIATFVPVLNDAYYLALNVSTKNVFSTGPTA